MTPQYRRMRCAVIVMASVMILASMLLVGVSLSMAEHIDELGSYLSVILMIITSIISAPCTPSAHYLAGHSASRRKRIAVISCNAPKSFHQVGNW